MIFQFFKRSVGLLCILNVLNYTTSNRFITNSGSEVQVGVPFLCATWNRTRKSQKIHNMKISVIRLVINLPFLMSIRIHIQIRRTAFASNDNVAYRLFAINAIGTFK
eukprot:NODE_1_length_95616_cov_0.657642.p79 type:complete len:107 gc:universal NODE_1_length_95616_cov_0.657642:80433-80753(+)